MGDKTPVGNNTEDIKKIANLLDDNTEKPNKLIEQIISRIHNWKFTSANDILINGSDEEKKDIDLEIWIYLDELHTLYGNCGWRYEPEYSTVKMSVHWIAHLLGYKFDGDKQNYVKVSK